MFGIKWSASRNFVRKIRAWKKDEIAMLMQRMQSLKQDLWESQTTLLWNLWQKILHKVEFK